MTIKSIKDNQFIGKDSITEVIHEQMKINNKAEAGRHNPKKFYPSSAGKCSRAIVYQMLGHKQEEFDGRTLLIFDNGNAMHNRIEHVLEQTGLLIAPELSFQRLDWRVSGRSDAVIHNFREHEPSDNIIELYEPDYKKDEKGNTIRDGEGMRIENGPGTLLYKGPDNSAMIVELKSISDKGFKYLDRGGARREHQLQLNLYMYLTGIKEGMLLYENKNTQEMKEFLIPYNEELAKEIVSQIIYVNKFVDDEKLPPREFERTDFQCRYCGYKDKCWPVRNTYDLDEILGA